MEAKKKKEFKITINLSEDTDTKLRDYAYTERLTISEVVNRLLVEFLADKTGLLHKPDRAAV